ncbi:MAG: hypothetical protein ACMG5Z_01260 [Luteimonas sp.]
MTRNSLHTAIAVALIGTLALVGCKKKDETAAIPPPATEPMPAPATMPTEPAATTTSVTMVDLGNTIGADNRVTVPSTTFAKGDTIHASVATDGAAGNLTAKWTFGDQVVDTQDKAVAAGPQVTEFSVSKPDGWPAGKYKLEVSSNGMVVQTREFEVK